jgi:uncharacterized protein RhaS with RHS repeats
LEPDPLGYTDSPNLYAYVLNDPVNLTDPLGLKCGGVTGEGDAIVITKCLPSGGGGLPSPSIGGVNFPEPRGRDCPLIIKGCRGLPRQPQPEPKDPPPSQCPPVPTPGPGKKELDQNIDNAGKWWPHSSPFAYGTGSIFDLIEEAGWVTTGQNYKAFIKGAAAFGNFNFGATMQARGFSLTETLEWSDTFQVLSTRRNDPPEDIRDVTKGYKYAQNGCYK